MVEILPPEKRSAPNKGLKENDLLASIRMSCSQWLVNKASMGKSESFFVIFFFLN